MSLRVSVVWLVTMAGPAFEHMPGRILFHVGIFGHMNRRHDNFIAAALCRAAAGADYHALRRVPQTMTVLMLRSFSLSSPEPRNLSGPRWTAHHPPSVRTLGP